MPGPAFPELARMICDRRVLEVCEHMKKQGYGYEDIAVVLRMMGRRTEPKTVRFYLIPKSIRAGKRAA